LPGNFSAETSSFIKSVPGDGLSRLRGEEVRLASKFEAERLPVSEEVDRAGLKGLLKKDAYFYILSKSGTDVKIF
jgi:hypothetical protein